jgi:hypothetical protein
MNNTAADWLHISTGGFMALHIKIVAMNFVYNLLGARSLSSAAAEAHLHNTIFECEWEFVHAAPAALA